MRNCEKEISEEIYQRAMENKGWLKKEDYCKVFSDTERMGYGVYGYKIFEKDGRRYVSYMLGSSCD